MDVLAGMSRQSTPETTLDEDTVFDLLGNERRRACLKQLLTIEGETPVDELARSVAETIADASTQPKDLQQSVYISLCQSHLPKLDRAAIIEYDSDRKTVGRGPTFDQVKPYLETRRSVADSWRYYTGLSILTVLLLAVGVVGASFVRPYLTLLLLVGHLGVSIFGISRLLED